MSPPTPRLAASVLIAGATDEFDRIADFSNRAGSAANLYFTALGVRVLSIDENSDAFLYSGTSYAAPGVSGALALLFSAFPNLTADEAIQLLRDTARDLGERGIDPVYGQGGIDLTGAFQSQGAMRLAGTATLAGAGAADSVVTTGGAAGDGGKLSSALGTVVLLDRFGRAFEMRVADRVAARAALGRLATSMLAERRGGRADLGPAQLSLSLRGGERRTFAGSLQTRGLDARGGLPAVPVNGAFTAEPVAGTKTAAGYGVAPSVLLDTLTNGTDSRAWLGSGNVTNGAGIAAGEGAAVAHRLGDWTLGISVGSGRSLAARRHDAASASQLAIVGTRDLGPARLQLGYERLAESGSFLGSSGSAVLGVGGADSDFATLGADMRTGDWRLSGSATLGMTRLRIESGGLAKTAGMLTSSAFDLAVTRADALIAGDHIGMKLSQPLRFESGVIGFRLPSGYDYAADAPLYSRVGSGLSPSGREIAVEGLYEVTFADSYVQSNLFYRHQPGHIAGANADLGVAVRLGLRF